MNYDNVDDGSVDSRKKRGYKKKTLMMKGKKRAIKEKFWPS
jgi:hypothetical protein